MPIQRPAEGLSVCNGLSDVALGNRLQRRPMPDARDARQVVEHVSPVEIADRQHCPQAASEWHLLRLKEMVIRPLWTHERGKGSMTPNAHNAADRELSCHRAGSYSLPMYV